MDKTEDYIKPSMSSSKVRKVHPGATNQTAVNAGKSRDNSNRESTLLRRGQKIKDRKYAKAYQIMQAPGFKEAFAKVAELRGKLNENK